MTAHQDHQTPFHFSPRPNRANEIRWNDWSASTFDRAHQEDKPILLAISAVWCHWCHVMDETSYSVPSIIELINERYVAVRVDNDQRPDINARYNQGGWPTTAFLSPDGALLAGATYLPPEQMQAALERVAGFYKEHRDEVEARAVEIRSRRQAYEIADAGSLSEEMIQRVLRDVEESYDPEYGGFGEAPKFPMVDVLEMLLNEYRASGEQRYYDMLAHTLLGMAGSGMYDHAEGGFFRYSTTRDWSVPHFEKMTEDHAGLLRVLSGLAHYTRNERFRGILTSALTYVRTVLRDPHSSFFAGSQDADEEYYALPLEERRHRQTPYVDRTSYSNWTAAMAGTFMLAAAALDDDELAAQGEMTLDALHDRMRDSDGLLFHFITPGGSPSVRGLLTDQAAYLRALLDAHEYGGKPRFLHRARELAAAIEEHLGAEDGGFYDHAAAEQSLGNLTIRDRPLPDNSLLAECYVRLSVLDDEPRYRDCAQRALLLYSNTYERAGLYGAAYARALRRYLSTPACVVLVGTGRGTADLREAAHNLPEAMLCVATIDAEDIRSLKQRGFDPGLHPAAYVCREGTCAAPARTADDLRGAYEALTR